MENTMSTSWEGIIPPLVTPFKPNGDIDFNSLERVVNHLVNASVDGLFVLGSTGEVAYLTDQQRIKIISFVAERAEGLPVFAGCIDLTANRVAERGLAALDAGANALVVTAPIYARNDISETADHFRMIAERVNAPILAYDIPVRVHSKLDAAMLIQLGEEAVIAGVKDSSGDDVSFRRLVMMNRDAGNPLSIFTGHEIVTDGMLLLGADGIVPGLGNVDPRGYVELWRLAKQKEWNAVLKVQDRLARLFEIVFQSPTKSNDAAGVGAFKVAMQYLGLIDHAKMAPPVSDLNESSKKKIRKILCDTELLTE